jgi:hypothetical protein
VVLKIGREDCPHCCRSEIYTSRPESIWEEMMILLLLRPVRCRNCMARFYRPLWLSTPINPNRRTMSEVEQQSRARHQAR